MSLLEKRLRSRYSSLTHFREVYSRGGLRLVLSFSSVLVDLKVQVPGYVLDKVEEEKSYLDVYRHSLPSGLEEALHWSRDELRWGTYLFPKELPNRFTLYFVTKNPQEKKREEKVSKRALLSRGRK